MADPITAFGVAAGVVGVLQALATGVERCKALVEGVKNVAENVEGLHGEVESMDGALRIIVAHIQNHSFIADLDAWWASFRLHTLLNNATRTVQRLEIILEDLSRDRRHLARLREYYRMKGYDWEINTLRLRISLYVVSLQAPMTVLTSNRILAETSAQASHHDEALRNLEGKLDQIEASTAELRQNTNLIMIRLESIEVRSVGQSRRFRQSGYPQTVTEEIETGEDNAETSTVASRTEYGDGLQGFEERQLFEENQELLEIAESLRRSIRDVTASAASRASSGGSVAPPPVESSTSPTSRLAQYYSSIVSVSGAPLSSTRRDRITNWLDSSDAAPFRVEPAFTSASSVSSQALHSQTATPATSSPPTTAATTVSLRSRLLQDQATERYQMALKYYHQENNAGAIRQLISLLESPTYIEDRKHQIVELLTKAYMRTDALSPDATKAREKFPPLNRLLSKEMYDEGAKFLRSGNNSKAQMWLGAALMGVSYLRSQGQDLESVVDWCDDCRLIYSESRLSTSPTDEAAEHALVELWESPQADSLKRYAAAHRLASIHRARALRPSSFFELIHKRSAEYYGEPTPGELERARDFAQEAAQGRRTIFGLDAPQTLSSIHLLVDICFELSDWAAVEGWLRVINGPSELQPFRLMLFAVQQYLDVKDYEGASRVLVDDLTMNYNYNLGWTGLSPCMSCIAFNFEASARQITGQSPGAVHTSNCINFTVLHYFSGATPKDLTRPSCLDEIRDLINFPSMKFARIDIYQTLNLARQGREVSVTPLTIAALSGAEAVVDFYLSCPEAPVADADRKATNAHLTGNPRASVPEMSRIRAASLTPEAVSTAETVTKEAIIRYLRWNDTSDWWRLSAAQENCVRQLISGMTVQQIFHLAKGSIPYPQILDMLLIRGEASQQDGSASMANARYQRDGMYPGGRTYGLSLLDMAVSWDYWQKPALLSLPHLRVIKETVAVLLRRGAEVNRQDMNSHYPEDSPLHRLAGWTRAWDAERSVGDVLKGKRARAAQIDADLCPVIELIKQAGGDLSRLNAAHLTPWQIAKTPLAKEALRPPKGQLMRGALFSI